MRCLLEAENHRRTPACFSGRMVQAFPQGWGKLMPHALRREGWGWPAEWEKIGSYPRTRAWSPSLRGGFHPSPDLGGGRRIRPISCTYKPRPRQKVSALHSVLPLAPRWPLGAPVSGAAEGNVARAPGSKQRGWPRSKETGNKCGDYHSTPRVRSIHPCAHTGPCTQAGLTGLCAVLPGIRSALAIYSQRDQMRGGLCAHFPSVHASSF